MKQFNYTTVMQVPKLVKITINEGLGEGTQDKKIVEEAAAELSVITGQKALVTVSKKDISNFKLRKGMPVGCNIGYKSNLHSQNFCNLVDINFREYDLLFYTKGIIAFTVKFLIYTFKVSDTRKRDSNKSLKELIHLLSTKSNFNSNRHTLTKFEV